MKGPWEVTCNIIGGTKMYRAYRRLDMSVPDHSGNREYSGDYVTDRSAAESAAKILNAMEAETSK